MEHGSCCPRWEKTKDSGGMGVRGHDVGCVWAETTAPWERVANRVISEVVAWWEKRKALGR